MNFCKEWGRCSDQEWAEIQRWEKLENPGYHIRKIPRGTFGEVSKIREELVELEDATPKASRSWPCASYETFMGRFAR